jgi:hypothetical protein
MSSLRAEAMPRRSCAALFALILCIVLGGCASSVAADLVKPAQQARAAVRSEQLAFDVLRHGRGTQALTAVVLTGMTKELSSAEKTIHEVDVSSPGDERLRDQVLETTRAATAASLAGRDCLSTKTSCDEAITALDAAGQRLDALVTQLEAQQ